MKKILLSALALATIFTACDKNDNDDFGNGGNDITASQWKINGATYTASQVNIATPGGVIVGTDANGNTFTVTFGDDIPSENGTFKIVAPIEADEADEVFVRVGILGTTPAAYTSMNSGNQNATVTVTNGKIRVSVPEITLRNPVNASETVQVSGSLVQP